LFHLDEVMCMLMLTLLCIFLMGMAICTLYCFYSWLFPHPRNMYSVWVHGKWITCRCEDWGAGRGGCIDTLSLISTLVAGEWSTSCVSHFNPGERDPGTHCIGGWMDPRTSLENSERKKCCPCRDSNSKPSPIAMLTALSWGSSNSVKSKRS
jgi:hypothetical protein